MYLPPHFEEKRPEVLHALLREHPLGLLVTQDAAGELAANTVPFVLDADPAGGPGILRAHVARANPVWRDARTDRDSLVVFQGPQAYISPGFYPSKAEHGKVVPTWNYVIVQGRGRLRAVDDAPWLRAFVTRLTDRHEAAREQPWAVTDAPDDYVTSMLRAIVGIEIELGALVGKWKVSQNRSAADRDGVARGLREAGVPRASELAGYPPAEA
ncbi:FMN-binding negative transcriptional regulator [Rhizobacter sp. Root404]|jgi:transcriptional regulator|uniref:FMN-binding negative transcriptional regulator n=1 Tax=Rhizobacter sp. Root404 TaxID=1736528 RepID=UPI0006F2F33E|nr:FMN-binding negative transcriptional regulator [Rhizobacter sp. Root404]KQW39031.1 transcriptional regulator [Rhizobacter sp. Root404]